MEANEINQSTMPDNTHPDKQSYSVRYNSSTVAVAAYNRILHSWAGSCYTRCGMIRTSSYITGVNSVKE